MNKYFENDYEIKFPNVAGIFKIKYVVGIGSSCVVYSATHIDKKGIETQHLLKEYNPYYINLSRDCNGALFVNSASQQKIFDDGLKKFENGYNRQIEIRNNEILKNSISNIQAIYYHNNTCYIDMTTFEGYTYDKVEENSLLDLLKRIKAIAFTIGKYHKLGFLHLDVKPENILTVPETCEMVITFDFDSVIRKNDVGKINNYSYTQSWAATEQLIPNKFTEICEATDIFAIGEILFYKLMGRHSTDKERRYNVKHYEYQKHNMLFDNVNPKVFVKLDEILSNSIKTCVKQRYQNIDLLIDKLDDAIELAAPNKPYLKSTSLNFDKYFIGRDKEFNLLHDYLKNSNKVFIRGVGGIGKSEFVKQYANKFANEYDTIIFMPYISNFESSFCNDIYVSINGLNKLEEEKINDYFLRKFSTFSNLCNSKTLLIVDNLDNDNEEKISNILKLNCDVLFTTRLDFSILGFSQINIESLKSEEIITLFKKYYTKELTTENEIIVNKIFQYVDFHTMTIELLAKQMMSGRITPDNMLNRLLKGGLSSTGSEKVKSVKDDIIYNANAYEHIKILFDLSNLNEDEQYVLYNLSLIPYSGIETSVFKKLTNILSYDAINSLEFGGFINCNKIKDVIYLHPIISDISFEKLKLDLSPVSNMLTSFSDYIYSQEFDSDPFEKKNLYRNIAFNICEKLVNLDVKTELISNLYFAVGNRARIFGDLKNAKRYLLKAYDIKTLIYSPFNNDTLRCLNDLGRLYRSIGDWKNAEKYLLKALKIRVKNIGEFHSSTATSYNNIGLLYLDMKDMPKAKEFIFKALEIREKINEHYITYLYISYIYQKSIFSDMCENEKIEEIDNKLNELEVNKPEIFFQNELKCFTSKLSKLSTSDESKLYFQLNNAKKNELYFEYIEISFELYSLYLNQKDILKALDILKEICYYCEDKINDLKICFCSSYGCVGKYYSTTGDLKSALIYHNKALNLSIKTFGKINPETTLSLTNVGKAELNINNIDEAEKHLKESLEKNIVLFGDNHTITADSYYNYSEVMLAKKDYTKAEQYYLKALDIKSKIYGINSRDACIVCSKLSETYKYMGNIEKSNFFLEKAKKCKNTY